MAKKYIDANELKKNYWKYMTFSDLHGIRAEFEEAIDAQPEADVRKNVRGKWIEVPDDAFASTYYCSNCKEMPIVDIYCNYVFSNFCPNCGADMRGEKDAVD